MREKENIKDLLSLEPDYIGFIFYPPSKRFMQTDIKGIDFGSTKKTGVFVDESFENILSVAKKYQLDVIQLHGHESPVLVEKLKNKGYEVFKAFSVDNHFDFNETIAFIKFVDFFIFDAKGKLPGGNGYRFDWKKLDEYQGEKAFLLSGGISPEHLDEIEDFSHPQFAGVDVNSGFEIEPAYKNINELRKFINRLRKK